MLYYFSGKKIHEVATLLSISPDAAAKRIQRAREALGERLLHALHPAVEPERSEEDRKASIMALILLMPVSWDIPLRPSAQPSAPLKPPAAPAATPTLTFTFLAKCWPLVLSALVLGFLVVVWLFNLGEEPPPELPAASQEVTQPQSKTGGKIAPPNRTKGSPPPTPGTKGLSKGKG
jgi:nitrate reductase NapE component